MHWVTKRSEQAGSEVAGVAGGQAVKNRAEEAVIIKRTLWTDCIIDNFFQKVEIVRFISTAL